MKTDFYTAIAQIAAERGIPKEAVLDSLEHALKTVYRKMSNVHDDVEVDVEIDSASGAFAGLSRSCGWLSDMENADTDIVLAEALTYDANAEIGGRFELSDTPDNFGRIAAQRLKQVVLQQIREYERKSVFEEYHERENEVINGIVQRADSRTVIIELGKTEAVMPIREQVPNERYRPGQRIKVLLKEVSRDQRGPQLVVLAQPGSYPAVVRDGSSGDFQWRGRNHGGGP